MNSLFIFFHRTGPTDQPTLKLESDLPPLGNHLTKAEIANGMKILQYEHNSNNV